MHMIWSNEQIHTIKTRTYVHRILGTHKTGPRKKNEYTYTIVIDSPEKCGMCSQKIYISRYREARHGKTNLPQRYSCLATNYYGILRNLSHQIRMNARDDLMIEQNLVVFCETKRMPLCVKIDQMIRQISHQFKWKYLWNSKNLCDTISIINNFVWSYISDCTVYIVHAFRLDCNLVENSKNFVVHLESECSFPARYCFLAP